MRNHFHNGKRNYLRIVTDILKIGEIKPYSIIFFDNTGSSKQNLLKIHSSFDRHKEIETHTRQCERLENA